MDTLFWIQSSPNITVAHTTKRYFNKYLCKLVVYAPAGRLIEGTAPIGNGLEYRRSIIKNVNYGGSWWAQHTDRQTQLLEDADVDFLEFLRTVKSNKLLNVKMRIEEPLIQIYGNNEETLKDLVGNHFSPTWARKYIESISVPANAEAVQLLESGAIIRRTENGYRYKVMIKDGRYDAELKESIRQYLQGVGIDAVYMPKGFEDQLLKGSFIWSGYFYTNDLGILSFLGIIRPGMVTNFHELVVAPHK